MIQNKETYQYNAHGNMLTMPHLSTMLWNYKNELKEVTLNASGDKAYYVYDSSGERVRKVIEKGNIIEERYYLGDYEVYRKTTNGTLDIERKTVHISDDKKRIALVETKTGESAVIRYQYDNHLGSASLELDENAEIISYEEYHPFGTTSYRSGRSETEVSLKRYKYVGKERDEETGLYYYGARYYSAWICRFVSVDPKAAEMPEWSPYSFSFNNPIFFIDPDGMKPTPSQAASMAWHIYDGKQEDVVDGWTLSNVYTDPENTGYKSGLYTREVDGVTEYTMVNMGTIPGTGKKNRDSMSENIEQPFGGSEHMELSLNKARELNTELGPDADLTFVGHSKGGGEAAANAVATNRDAYVFNPAAVNLKAYGLNSKNYTANMTAFVVKGDPVSKTYPLLSAKPIDKLIMLPRQSWTNPIENHNNFGEALRQYLENNTIED